MNKRAFAIASLIISVFIMGTFSPGLSIWGYEYIYHAEPDTGAILQHTTSFIAFLNASYFTAAYKALGVIIVSLLMINLIYSIIFTIRFNKINRHLLWEGIQGGLITFILILCMIYFYKNSYLQYIAAIIMVFYFLYSAYSYVGYKKALTKDIKEEETDKKAS